MPTPLDLSANVVHKAFSSGGIVVGSSNTDATTFSWSFDGSLNSINGDISANAVDNSGLVAGNTIDGAFGVNQQDMVSS